MAFLVKCIRNDNRGENQPKLSEEFITLSVDYSRTLEEMISAGNYDWFNKSINAKNFPIPPDMVGKKIEMPVKLLYFDRGISNREPILKMKETRRRPFNLVELLALGETWPDLQRQFSIVALGSTWNRFAGIRVPYLGVGDNNGRGIGLNWFDIVSSDSVLSNDCCFPTVHIDFFSSYTYSY